jgi:molecular chaperone DnaK (HSP70)
VNYIFNFAKANGMKGLQVDIDDADYLEARSEPSPEKRLAAAVIRRAILDACVFNEKRKLGRTCKKKAMREDREQAFEWIDAEDDGENSFKWWCSLIGLDAQYLQKLIKDLDYKLDKQPLIKPA